MLMQKRVEHQLKAMVATERVVLLEDACAELLTTTTEISDFVIGSRHLQLFDTIGGQVVISHRSRRPPTVQGVARAVAARRFCQNELTQPQLLSRQNVENYFPTVFRKGMPEGYYVRDARTRPVLGLLRVDAHMKPVGRMLSKSNSIAQRHFKQKEFRQLHQTGQFELTWLVPTEAKKRTLEITVAGFAKRCIALHAFVVPELLGLLAPLATHHSPTSRV